MKRKGILWGLLFILAAVYLVLRGLGFIIALPIWSIFFAAVFAFIAVEGLIHLEWGQFFFPLCFIGWIFMDELNDAIHSLNPNAGISGWTLFVIAMLLTIGFSMIFKKKSSVEFIKTENGNTVIENTSEGGYKIENSFSATSKYVNLTDMQRVEVENNFGQTNVYFENAIVSASGATIKVENNFGETNVYVPAKWRIDVVQKSAFGNVRVIGTGNCDMDAPHVVIEAEANFGEIRVHIG